MYIPHPYREERKCGICKDSFITKTHNSKYCEKHQTKNLRRSFGNSLDKKIPPSTVGTIAELEVCCDLLKNGYEVFKAVSSSCSCDLAILKDGILKRIEVRTGYRLKNNKIHYPPKNKADIMAVVIHREKTIIYIPKL